MSTSTQSAPKAVVRPGDRIFAGLSLGAGVTILVTLAAVATFLFWQAWPAISAPSEEVRGGEGLLHYVGPLVFGTIMAASIALLIATPLSIGIAIFITHYAPRRIAQPLGYLIDLLAAVPSIIYGLWGLSIVSPASVPLSETLETYLGWMPFFAGPASVTGKTMFVVGFVLAIMILPIMTAVNREVFIQTPRLQEEAAMALGATRWEMLRMAVIPFGRAGVVAGTMLGLGRALGETMAVAIILSPSARYTLNLISDANPNTIAADIALNFPESDPGAEAATLVAAGLVLFFITLVVNMAARWIVSKTNID